jgi:hypothetical protein
MREAVICAPLRTPVGAYGGVFRAVTAQLTSRPITVSPWRSAISLVVTMQTAAPSF